MARKASTAKKSRADTVAFVARIMRKNPDVSMTELKKLGEPKGYNIYPLIIGLARRELGMKRSAPARKAGRKARRKKTATRKAAATKTAPILRKRRGPGRPRKQTSAIDALEGVVSRVRELEQEVQDLRAALARIAEVAVNA